MVYQSLILNCAVPNNIIINTVGVKASWRGLFVIVWAGWCEFWVGGIGCYFAGRGLRLFGWFMCRYRFICCWISVMSFCRSERIFSS